MNILLVQAYIGDSESPVYPNGLSHLAASAKHHSINIFDPNVSQRPYQEFAELLESLKPDLVGISLRNIDSTNKRKVVFYYEYFKKMVSTIQDTLKGGTKIVVGGSGFSMFAKKIMEDETRIDFGVFGESEIIFPELLENMNTPENVKGLFYKKNGRFYFTGTQEYPEPDAVPFSDRFIINVEPYKNVPEGIGVETKRGCAMKCVYCIYGFLNGRKYRLRNPHRVVDEIEFLLKKHKVKKFTFIDSVFNFPLYHAEEVCKEMIARRLSVSWSAWFHDNYMTEEFVQLTLKAGCNKFILSPDGFTDNVLRRLGKTQKEKDISKTFNILKKVHGVEICYNFFKNPPGQSPSAFFKMLFFVIRAKLELKERVHFEFNSIRIEPNTELHKIALKEGVIDKDDDLLYPKNYTNPRTRYIEMFFDMIQYLKGQ